VNKLSTLLALLGSLCLAIPALIFLLRRRDYKRFLDTYKAKDAATRENDKLWLPARDSMLFSLVGWSRIDACALFVGALLLLVSFVIELFS